MNRTVPLSEAHLQARSWFVKILEWERKALASALFSLGMRVDIGAPVATLLALARHSDDPEVRLLLQRFEAAIRGPLEAYVTTVPKRDVSRLNAAGRLLLTHFRDYTEVPIAPNWVKRVLIWCHQTLRAWRR